MRFPLKALLIATAITTVWFAAIEHGMNVAGSTGAIIAGVCSGTGFTLVAATLRCLGSRKYACSAFCIVALMAVTYCGHGLLDFSAIWAAPELHLTRNLASIEQHVSQNSDYRNIHARIQKEAIGGCIVLTGTAPSKAAIDRLEAWCRSIGQAAIDNRIIVEHGPKSE